ncbi:MAG: hypothetical protein KatS3mg102_0052 [Planctomycetota bacterium]|nr:MAG: hypothetical protein KatS3mg102_0052 [Planctomycetota bacterium]
MRLPFVKLQGLRQRPTSWSMAFRQRIGAEPGPLVRRLSDRHFGVGADGLIVVEPSECAHARMRMWNADGTESGMCGNGVRLAVKLAREAGHLPAEDSAVRAGGRPAGAAAGPPGAISCWRASGWWARASPWVCRGFGGARCPCSVPPQELALDVPLEVPVAREGAAGRPAGAAGAVLSVSGVSMGNPHCVVFLAHPPADEEVRGLGPRLERHPAFPERANISWAYVEGPDRIRLRVWERGAGETLACGSGACATVAAAIRTGRLGASRRARVMLPGGELEVSWPRARGPDRAGRARGGGLPRRGRGRARGAWLLAGSGLGAGAHRQQRACPPRSRRRTPRPSRRRAACRPPLAGSATALSTEHGAR